MSQYSIGEVAQQFNITVRTLQYYHKKVYCYLQVQRMDNDVCTMNKV